MSDAKRHYRSSDFVLVPHWEAAINGKPFATVTAPDREAARVKAASEHKYLTPAQCAGITVRYLCNK